GQGEEGVDEGDGGGAVFFGDAGHGGDIGDVGAEFDDDGDVGAFKVVNSWGAGWGPSNDGTYYITYDAFATLVWSEAYRFLSDKPQYQPSLLAVWNINPQGPRNAPIELGVGPYGSPEETRNPVFRGGTHAFPFFMALDISEFTDNRNAGTFMFYLEIGVGAGTSTISSFKVESYESGYTIGNPTEISEESPDTPEDTPGYVTLWFPSGKGKVKFDNIQYKSDATATIILADRHLNMNPGGVETYLIDEVRSDPTGDSETTTVLLTENGVNTAVFTGTIQLQLGTANINDGILQVANNDIINVTYNDANNGTGNPATVFDTAGVDDDPPIISGVLADPSYMTAVVTWSTNEESDSDVGFGLAAPPGSTESDTGMTTLHMVELTGLSLDTTYYYSVSSTDYAGNLVTDDNSAAYYTFSTLPPEVTPWSDDMDSGHDWWDNEDDDSGTEWELGDPAGFGPGSAYSGTNCWGTNIDTQYTDNAEAWLTIPPIDLILAADSNMTFWNWYDIEVGWDTGRVEISTDLGDTWMRIAPVGGYPDTSVVFGDGYAGVSGGWVSGPEEEFDLTPYVGYIVLVRFRFISDQGLFDDG
ncbi:MAG: immune inhibitor A, partial [Gammaproteobacteria bacterium]|nr:immune inhibitor A [Gammaproteobacteria bacterium]